jgi:hypothetical protein
MVALNFPASPSNGDEFQGYVYDSTLQVWNRKPSTVAYTVSPTVPANPNDGDVWFNEQDGSSYIYYIDEDSEQWVEIGGKVGATGSSGQDGVDGIGLPVGGSSAQALVKASSTDYDFTWANIPTTLNDFIDIEITTPADGQALVYDDATSKWGAGDVASGPLPAKTIASDAINIDFSDGIDLETRAVTGDVNFTASNYTSGVKKTIYLEGDTVQRSLTFPTNWNFITDTPTAIGANKKNLLDLNSFGTSESTTVALWLGVSAFEPIVATGGTEYLISIDGVQWKVHSFTATGSLSVSSIGSIGQADYLVVAGGGGGGNYYSGGGGGAGGLLTSISGELSGGGNLPGPMIQLSEIDYLATVGSGGAGGPGGGTIDVGSNGQNSSFAGINAIGGGGGGGGGLSGAAGGSGGGSGGNGQATGTFLGGIGSQGYGGGNGYSNSNNYGAGGGGGAGSPGLNGDNTASGAAGIGLISSITGQDVYYSGGGGAGTHTGTSLTRTLGGLGGGGDGGVGGGNNSGLPGVANTGGGGGGGTYQSATGAPGGAGGSGIIIVRYPITDPN